MVPTKISNFHDGYFDGLWIGPNKLVQFFLTTVNQQSFVLILEGVQRPTLTDIKEGNIILDLVLRGTEELTHSDVRDLYGGGSDTSQVLSLLKTAKEQGLQVLEINSSYDAQGLVLFQSWELSQRQVQP